MCSSNLTFFITIMQQSITNPFRFRIMLSVFIMSVFGLFSSLSPSAFAQSFTITGQKNFNLKVGNGNIINITNLAGKTQYLNVAVWNGDVSLKLQMLDINSH